MQSLLRIKFNSLHIPILPIHYEIDILRFGPLLEDGSILTISALEHLEEDVNQLVVGNVLEEIELLELLYYSLEFKVGSHTLCDLSEFFAC